MAEGCMSLLDTAGGSALWPRPSTTRLSLTSHTLYVQLAIDNKIGNTKETMLIENKYRDVASLLLSLLFLCTLILNLPFWLSLVSYAIF